MRQRGRQRRPPKTRGGVSRSEGSVDEPQRPLLEIAIDLVPGLADEEGGCGFQPAGVVLAVLAKSREELFQNAFFLHVHAKVSGLGVVDADRRTAEVSIFDQRCQRPQLALLDGSLQTRQTPVGQTLDPRPVGAGAETTL